MFYSPLVFNRSLASGEISGGLSLEQAQLQKEAAQVRLNEAKTPHLTAEEMDALQPQLEKNLAALTPERKAKLDDLTHFLLSRA